MITGVIDHVQQHRAGAHGPAFARDERELQGFIQRGVGLAFAPVAVPVIDVFLCHAQIGEIGMQQIVRSLEAVPPAFEVGLPDAVHDVDVVQRANHVLEHRDPFFVDLARWQIGQAVKETLIGPAFVIGQHAGCAYVNHQRSPIVMGALQSIVLVRRGSSNADHRSPSACATRSASARQLVSPGDSMPNRLTSPGTPCVAGSLMMKSAAGSVGPVIFGRTPL